MLRDFVLETVVAPTNSATITLPGTAPPGRVTWAAAFVTSQKYVFYVLDDSTQQEWGVGTLTVGSPSTITRPTVVMGNSAGSTIRLTFNNTTRCYCGLPSAAQLAGINSQGGRNILHNSRFIIAQRGGGPFTAVGAVYTSDRWYHNNTHSTGSYSDTIQAMTDAQRVAVGDEDATTLYQSVVVGGSGASDLDLFGQRVEDARRMAGKTVTLSFWAAATAGTPKVGVELAQAFGTGGSPSSAVQAIGATAITLSTTLTRYAVTIAVPSVAGKTFGSNADSYTEVQLWLSSGTTFATRSSSIGVQSATFLFWGVQLEVGPAPTALERVPFGQDYVACLRYYQSLVNLLIGSYGATGAGLYAAWTLLTPMRTTPTATFNTVALFNCATLSIYGPNPLVFSAYAITTTTGSCTAQFNVNLSADL